MDTRALGKVGPRVSSLGLGCMGMSDLYGPADRAESMATIHAALDAGVTLLDTGDFYGMGHNELLLREALAGRPRDARPEREVRRAARRPPEAGTASTAVRRRSRTSSPTRCSGSGRTTWTSIASPGWTLRSRSRRRWAPSRR